MQAMRTGPDERGSDDKRTEMRIFEILICYFCGCAGSETQFHFSSCFNDNNKQTPINKLVYETYKLNPVLCLFLYFNTK